MAAIQVRPLATADLDWVRDILVRKWQSPRIVRRGSICNADRLPGFVAVREDRRVGLVTYVIQDEECEIVTLNSLEEGIGVGTSLVEAVRSEAITSKCRRLWLITTNDNLEALSFYQRRGFVLAALYRNALEQSRKLKPEIPRVGSHGIPIRDEIELEMNL